MEIYKAELNHRYWTYQNVRFQDIGNVFDRPRAQDMRPPVFKYNEAWRNIIINPNAEQQEREKLLALVPKSDRHKWYGSMNSSQALAQSVFGNLALYGYLSILQELQDEDGSVLFGEASIRAEDFEMEHKIDHLGEPRRTSIDCYLGGDYRVAIKCKFTEAEVGTCSRPRLTHADSNYEKEHCDRTYTKQRKRAERCSLTEVGVLYWRYVPKLFLWNSEQDITPCPLHANYQLVRNIIAIGARPDGSVSLSEGHVVLVYDERNPAFQNGGKGLASYEITRQALFEPKMLRKCSWQQIIRSMRTNGVLGWLTTDLEAKYGL
jgi:hypothetical protein